MLKPVALAVLLTPLAFVIPATADEVPFGSPGSFTSASYNWSGAYVGLSAGGAWGDTGWTFVPFGNSPSPNPQHISDVVGGAHVGIQHQWGNFVLGVEANFIFNHLEGSPDCPNTAFTCNTSIDHTWEVGPRAGFAWNNFLLYATGGYANSTVQTEGQLKGTSLIVEPTKEDHNGFYVGGGIDWGITRNIILGVEYQHVDLEEKLHPTIEPRLIDPEFDVVRARLTFKFDREDREPAPLK